MFLQVCYLRWKDKDMVGHPVCGCVFPGAVVCYPYGEKARIIKHAWNISASVCDSLDEFLVDLSIREEADTCRQEAEQEDEKRSENLHLGWGKSLEGRLSTKFAALVQ